MTTPTRCDRRFAHRPHPFVTDPAADPDQCPGREPAHTLAELLDAFPELSVLGTPAVVMQQLAVMCA